MAACCSEEEKNCTNLIQRGMKKCFLVNNLGFDVRMVDSLMYHRPQKRMPCKLIYFWGENIYSAHITSIMNDLYKYDIKYIVKRGLTRDTVFYNNQDIVWLSNLKEHDIRNRETKAFKTLSGMLSRCEESYLTVNGKRFTFDADFVLITTHLSPERLAECFSSIYQMNVIKLVRDSVFKCINVREGDPSWISQLRGVRSYIIEYYRCAD